MNPWINYHHLFYFKSVAENGTVSGAAKKLRIGQPTLSAQLKQFEETLGVQLFERQHKKLILTEQGKVALEYSKNIFKMGSEMIEVLNDRLVPNKPTLHLGALDSVPKNIILQLSKQAYKISPCQITLSEGRANELLQDLATHKIDLVISNYLPSGSSSKDFFHRTISNRNVSFYGAPKFKFLRKNFPQSISGQAMIFPTYDSKLREDLDHWCKNHNVEQNIIAESQDISVNKLMAIEELGIIPTASHTVTRQVLNGELIEIGALKGITENLFLISAQRKIENKIAAKIMASFNV